MTHQKGKNDSLSNDIAVKRTRFRFKYDLAVGMIKEGLENNYE